MTLLIVHCTNLMGTNDTFVVHCTDMMWTNDTFGFSLH